ncbi:MAG: hypothetical protein ACOYZ8_02015 [Chloroflexota bacterium]
MEVPNDDKILVDFVWGNLSFRRGYTQIGSFQNDAPNWPRIYVTVPVNWASSHSELLNTVSIKMAKEFIKRFNDGEVRQGRGRFEILQTLSEEQMVKIKVHKDAAVRFNEEGIALVALCESGKYFLETQQRKRGKFPKAYSHGKLTDENIISIEVSMKNGFGEQIASYFEDSQIGLEGDNYKRFVKLCESIQRAIRPESTISRKMVEEFAFKWLERKYQKLTSVNLLEYLIPNLENEIREFEIWIPIAELRTERIVPLGKIEIRPITAEWLKSWQKISLSDTPKGQRKGKAAFYKERITKPLQGWSAGVIRVRADRETAIKTALFETERSLALLRFFSIAALTSKINSYVAIKGSENIEAITSLTFVDGRFAYFNETTVDLTSYQTLSLDEEMLSRMTSSGIGILDRLLHKQKLTSFEEKILESIILYSNATREKNLSNKIIYILTALENIFLQNDTESIAQNLSERIAIFIGKDFQEKKKIIGTIKAIYKSRSKFLHHAQTIRQLEELEQFIYYAFLALANTIQKVSAFSTAQDFASHLDDLKLS